MRLTPKLNTVQTRQHQKIPNQSVRSLGTKTLDSKAGKALQQAPAPNRLVCRAGSEQEPELIAEPTAKAKPLVHFDGDYWQEGYCHLISPIQADALTKIGEQLGLTVTTQAKHDPEKLHHRNAHLDRHIPSLKVLLNSDQLANAVKSILGEPGVLVRTTLINKPAQSRWHVNWHQDKSPLTYRSQTIKKAARANNQNEKETSKSNPHEQLAGDQLVAVRIHLDSSHHLNGGLEVIPSTHRQGLFSQEELQKQLKKPHVLLNQPKGCIMLMHPYLLHASGPNNSNFRRRVVHCEYITASAFAALAV